MRQRSKSPFGILLFFLMAATGAFAVPQAFASSGSGSSGSDEPAPDDDDDRSGPSDNSGSSDDQGEPDSGDGGESSGSSNDSESDSGTGHGDSVDSGQSANSGSSGSGDDDDNDSSSGSSNQVSGPSENSGKGHSGEERVARAQDRFEISENDDGDLVRSGEVVHVSSHADISTMVARRGLRIIEIFQLPSMGMKGLRIAVPNARSGHSVLDELRRVDPRGISTFNHIYSPARGGATIAGVSSLAPQTLAKRAHIRIGLVDAGVDSMHEMLRDVKISAQTFGAAKSTPENHGTAVASRIAEAAPGAHIIVANVFTMMENGKEIASADAIVQALDWLSQMKIPVINLSLSGPANPLLEAMAAHVSAKGHILVAAVGNEGPHAAPQFPAAYENVVGVTAVDKQDRVYLYANQGDYVDFAAGGVDTTVANSSGDVEKVSGTSYAAPVVAVALARRIDRPDVALAQSASQFLAKSARDLGQPGRDPIFGYGLVGLEK